MRLIYIILWYDLYIFCAKYFAALFLITIMVHCSRSQLSRSMRFILVAQLLLPLCLRHVTADPGLRWAKRIALSKDANSTGDPVIVSEYCDPQYFDVKYFNESHAGPWYAEWVHSVMAENSPAWQARMSEPQYFALHQLHWMDMDCGVTHKGCVNMPNCDQVLQRVDGNVTLARNIYFILQSFHNLNLIGGVVSVRYLFARRSFVMLR